MSKKPQPKEMKPVVGYVRVDAGDNVVKMVGVAVIVHLDENFRLFAGERIARVQIEEIT